MEDVNSLLHLDISVEEVKYHFANWVPITNLAWFSENIFDEQEVKSWQKCQGSETEVADFKLKVQSKIKIEARGA